jgi:nicotinamide riboside kinase
VGTAFMKIGIIGSFSTGKTTLVTELANILKKSGRTVGVVDEVARRCPLPIDKTQSLQASLWILNTTINDEILSEHNNELTITDRSAFDVWAYVKYNFSNKNKDSRLMSLIESTIRFWLPTYDFLFYAHIDPELEIEADGVRIADRVYQKEIDRLLRESLDYFMCKVIDLPRMLSERVQTVLMELESMKVSS